MVGTDASITIARDENGLHMSVHYDAQITRRQFFDLLTSQKDLYKLQFFHDSTTIKLCDIVRSAPRIKILLYGNACDRTRQGIAASEIALSEIEELYIAWQGRCWPKWLFSLPRLKNLELSSPDIRSLPRELYAMTKLEILTLHECYSLEFSLRKMKRIKTLNSIYAEASQISRFPYLEDYTPVRIEMPCA